MVASTARLRPEGPREGGHDYSRPERTCDVVMKGGITSGVVYPYAVCELARVYRLRNVGGTSAGAIAAAAAGAAELGRDSGGFTRLAALPAWLSHGDNLLSLFQPQSSTRKLFRILVGALGSPKGRAFRLLLASLRGFGLWAIAGAAPGVAVAALAALDGSVAGLAGGAVLALLGATLALVAGVLRGLARAVPENGFGLCSGAGEARGRPALTPWLADLLDDLAGRPAGGSPLTFGDLAQADVRLEFMTTNLTQRRPQKLPFETRELFFDPAELGLLFPTRVVDWLKANPPPPPEDAADRREWEALCRSLEPLRPLPAPDDLPVIVATRMSLSFPLLLSAVPLWAVDASRRSNQLARAVWRRWLRDHAEEWDTGEGIPAGAPAQKPAAECCWFSDGGITSNFPVHFFDAPLPLRPTFAVNLRPFHPDYPPQADESRNVYLPGTSGGGLLEWWYRFPEKRGLSQLSAFAQAVVRTMQNRVDEAQMRVPGYRDRVVHIGFTEREGGMNLTMPPDVISALTARGRHAGVKLIDRFARPPATPSSLSWDSHRWTRYRSTLAAVAEIVGQVDKAFHVVPEVPGDRTYEELAARPRGKHPRAYPWARDEQRRLGADFTEALGAAAGVATDAEPETLEEDAPRPRPQARIVPRT
jgi:predicted acylesterase/phospholipase RssA